MYLPSDFLRRNAAMFPDRLAVVAQGLEITYRALDELSDEVAGALRGRGVRRGDRVAYLLGNNGAAVVLFHAIMKLGAVAVPLNKRLMADDLAYMLDHVRARAFVFDADIDDVASEAVVIAGFSGLLVVCGGASSCADAMPWADFRASASLEALESEGYGSLDDECLVLFTSGTTGRPKAVLRTAGGVSMLATVQLVEGHSHESDVDVLYTQAPLFHMGGLCAMLKICASGGTLVLESHFRPEVIFDLIESYSVNQLYMIPPALFSRLADSDALDGRTFPSVHEAQCAGGRTRDCDRTAVFSLFPKSRVRTSFGSSESGMTCTSYYTADQLAARPERAASVGTVNSFVTIKIVDEAGAPVPEGTPGEALVKSPMVFSGYLELPEATAAAFDEEGYFRTGDILYRDEEGFFVFVDRVSDIIKTGGENVFAVEVERVLQQFPGIVDCAVIGVDDSDYGEAIAAAVVLDEAASDAFSCEALLDFCRHHMASFKKPRYILVLDEVPRNNLGKVQKHQLRLRQADFRPIVPR